MYIITEAEFCGNSTPIHGRASQFTAVQYLQIYDLEEHTLTHLTINKQEKKGKCIE